MKKHTKPTIFIIALSLITSFSFSQTSVYFVQQKEYYDNTFLSGGATLDNENTVQIAMDADGGSAYAVAWRDLETTGNNTGSARSLQVGDEFRISVSAHTVRGTMGFALLATPTSRDSWEDRLENKSIYLTLSNSGNWTATYYGDATTTGSATIGGNTSYKNFVFTCLLTAPNRMTISITDGVTTSYLYDLQLYTSNPITDYSVYLNDGYDGSSNNNILWNSSSGDDEDYVRNTGAITIGSSNSDITITDVIPNGLAANSTSTSSANTLTKVGSGELTISANNTYSGGTTVSAGTLYSGAGHTSNETFGSGSISVASGATLWIDRSDDGVYTNTLTLAGGTFQITNGFSTYYDGNIVLTGNSTINAQSDGYLDGIISGTYNLTKTG
ncbi:MAG: autotransporter-associated beta strand repeat-containing protein, partial [Bacteroidales bacterium]|nr:autotransporter-associated beta strand repeat-containing protein [Bacteroidales bacterium]